MPRGIRKHGEFDFTIWFADGARIQWKSIRSQTDAEIAAAIRRYLLPVAERLEKKPATSKGRKGNALAHKTI